MGLFGETGARPSLARDVCSAGLWSLALSITAATHGKIPEPDCPTDELTLDLLVRRAQLWVFPAYFSFACTSSASLRLFAWLWLTCFHLSAAYNALTVPVYPVLCSWLYGRSSSLLAACCTHSV